MSAGSIQYITEVTGSNLLLLQSLSLHRVVKGIASCCYGVIETSTAFDDDAITTERAGRIAEGSGQYTIGTDTLGNGPCSASYSEEPS